MKKISLAIIIFLLFLTGAVVAQAIGSDKKEAELGTIVEGMEAQGIDVKKWSLFSKEMISDENQSFEELTKLLQTQFRHYKWSNESVDGKLHKASGIFFNKKMGFTEKLQIQSTDTNGQKQSYILYELSGEGSGKNWIQLHEYAQARSFDIFHENPSIFTCVNGQLDDKMSSVLQLKVNGLLKQFNAVPVEQLKEDSFISVSARTSDWDHLIPTDEGSMNIQIALRGAGLGSNTSVTVGTPIITSEY
ncbi:YwmB family TATA-box binding protein [Metabacillus dongyingensis]|uniref:YwmB family TATA-box binding protein n=1 Tax=Metabacillus dongyingensis TaxID=2874282 RepID=UPI003B8D389E